MSENSFLGTETLPEYTPTSDEKTMAILSHVLTMVAGFLAPLIIFIIKKDESKFVSAHAKESLNFQLTLMLVFIGLIITVIGILLIWLVGIFMLIMVIVATVRASEGKLYKYPFSIKFIK